MRKLTSVIGGAAIVVAALVGMGSAAGAADAASCSFSVAASSAGHVDITGTAPAGSYVKAFVGGNAAGDGTADGAAAFAILGVAGSVSDTITVSYSANPNTAYPTTSCARVGGEDVVRVAGATTDPSAAAALAFTGSSGTSSLVLVGLAAVVAGLALVLGLRRRGACARIVE